MHERLARFVAKNKLFQKKDRILIAVSGGVDSVMLCHLFHQSNYNFGIAHCNFQLRGNASDEDATFVKKLAHKLNVPFFLEKFDTKPLAKEKKISVQLIARELRYEWLEQIRLEENFNYIATAHHLNDSIETVLYNFTKGCGIRGLHGIPVKNGHIIRPLLFIEKDEILQFCIKQSINYREDASNATDEYSRNKIRHNVIPGLKALNPGFEKTMEGNIQRIQETEAIFDWAIAQIEKRVITKKNGLTKIDIQALMDYPAPNTFLFELLSPFGFSAHQVKQMLPYEKHQTGIVFYSPTHTLLLDRSTFLIKQKERIQEDSFVVPASNFQFHLGQENFVFQTQEATSAQINANPIVAQIDLSRLSFPLLVRHWKKGDYFCPIGMGGRRQKLQDFFTNNKFNRFQKEETWILETAKKEICWVIGYRMDDRFKITDQTTLILKAEYHKTEENE